MPSKKSQFSSKLFLIPHSFASFKQKMVFMLRNNQFIQSQIQLCIHIAKPSRSRLFLRFTHAQSYSNTATRDQFGPGGKTTLHLSLPRTVLVYTYYLRITNNISFILKSIPVQVINYSHSTNSPNNHFLEQPIPQMINLPNVIMSFQFSLVDWFLFCFHNTTLRNVQTVSSPAQHLSQKRVSLTICASVSPSLPLILSLGLQQQPQGAEAKKN